jgi:hypothetical protein
MAEAANGVFHIPRESRVVIYDQHARRCGEGLAIGLARDGNGGLNIHGIDNVQRACRQKIRAFFRPFMAL